MKKILIIFTVLILLAGFATGGLYIYNRINEITYDNITEAVVRDIETDSQTVYNDLSDIHDLFYDLKSGYFCEIPDYLSESYEISLTNRWNVEYKYTLHLDTEHGSIYLRNQKTYDTYLVENPRFIGINEIFDKIYEYRSSPNVYWVSSINNFTITSQDGQWFYKKLDGSWYKDEDSLPVISDAYVNTEYINELDKYEFDLTFTSDYIPDDILVEITNEENELILEESFINDFILPIIDEEGLYEYTVKLVWNNEQKPYKGSYTCKFKINIDLPVKYEFSDTEILQGDVLKITALNVNKDEELFLNQGLCKNATFFEEGHSRVAYIPISYYTSHGTYQIEYGIEGQDAYTQTITVVPRDFHIQYLYINEETAASTRNDASTAEYNKYFVPVRLTSNEAKYYSQPFVIPAKGRLSTEFGETRHVNNSPTSYRHSGIDIAAPAGTPIYATNRGKVVLSMFLISTGNTIVIDHGQGLFSVYFHMNELHVKTGEIVERGQQIGTMGSTGFSTGPHLHFTMSIFDTNIEPGYFIAGEPLTYDNYKKYLE